MTWHTSSGDRVLTDAERSLVLHGAEMFMDCEPDREPLVEVLRGLNPDIMGYSMLRVLEALFTEGPLFPLTAWSEAMVMETFQRAIVGVEQEVQLSPNGEGHGPYWIWRNLIRAAEAQGREAQGRDPEDTDVIEGFSWNDRVRFLSDRILWDADFEGGSIVDLPPELTGVDPGYFDSAPALPVLKERERLSQFHRKIREEGHTDWERWSI